MEPGDHFRLTLFTAARIGCHADRAGVDRIGPDLEHLGKLERQHGMSTWISDHTEADLPARFRGARALAALRALQSAPSPREEIERLVAYGAQVIMLPHFHSVDEAAHFVGAVDGSEAQTVLLVETAARSPSGSCAGSRPGRNPLRAERPVRWTSV
jgi:hypothetical protein